MSELNDPRVLFAAERTQLAWSRTAAGLMAIGFLFARAEMALRQGPHGAFSTYVGLAFILLGVAISLASIRQYRCSIAGLRPVEIPAGYWVNFSAWSSLAIGVLGVLLCVALLWG